jgi:ATP-dependent Clp protease ATP-binding subunit ClpA
MTRHSGDDPCPPGKLSRAVAALLGLSSSRGRNQFGPTVCATGWVKGAPEANAGLFDRLTPEGHHVLDDARYEACALGHHKVGTEHLLLALTRNLESGACRVMEQMRTAPLRVRTDVLGSLACGTEPPPAVDGKPAPGPLGLTPRARLAVELGHRASARIGAPLTGPEHLLIGLAAEGEGIAAKALRKSGITARTAENRVASDLGGRTAAP